MTDRNVLQTSMSSGGRIPLMTDTDSNSLALETLYAAHDNNDNNLSINQSMNRQISIFFLVRNRGTVSNFSFRSGHAHKTELL